MKFITIFRMALSSLGNNKLRSALALLGIVIGITAVISLMSIGKGIQAFIVDSLESQGSNLVMLIPKEPEKENEKWNFFNLSDVDALKDKENAPSIMNAVAEKSWSGKIVLGDKSINSTVLGITDGYYDVSNLDLGFGIFITETHQEDVRKVIVIGTRIVEKLFDNQNPIGQQVRVLNHRFTVVGVMDEQDNPGWGVDPNKTAYIPITTMYETLSPFRPYGEVEKEVDWIKVKAVSFENVPMAMAETAKIMRFQNRIAVGEDDDFIVTNQQEILNSLQTIINAIIFFLTSIAAISLLVGGIGIMNIMLVSVTERTREIGIRKALGAKRSDILYQFVVEAILLTGTGGILGIALGYGVSVALDGIPFGNGENLETAFTLDIALLALGVSAAIGLFFGIFPAYRAAKLHPIEALRYQ
ncbi:MAG: ABC transporter permease [Chloroflexi bacterium]|nr:ABC transporter permease [Chloroflexota bacterium]